MKKLLLTSLSLSIFGAAFAQLTGPSSSQSAYYLPKHSGVETKALLTVGDSIGGYKMVGIPDGIGARRNSAGGLDIFMTHELGTTQGINRAHGAKGAFISKWNMDLTTHAINSGADLITSVAGVAGGAAPFARFCSANLAKQSAFYNAATGLGTQNGIFMCGEETGAEGRAFGTLLDGPNAGQATYLASLGRFSWENAVAHEGTGNKTVVAGTDDSTPGQVYFYEGMKTNSGDDYTKAGLVGGKTYGVALDSVAIEGATTGSAAIGFGMVDLGDISGLSGASLETASTAAGVTRFARPEDFAWDPTQSNVAYFATTGITGGVGNKLWKMTFSDMNNISAGGQMEAVLDSTDGIVSIDNLCVDKHGNVIIQEDPGNNSRLSKIWHYNGTSGALNEVASSDPSRFLTGGSNFLTQDEESSGIIDASEWMGDGWFIFDVQAHYANGTELVEGGQLMAMRITSPVPEPGTMTALALGVAALVRKRKQK